DAHHRASEGEPAPCPRRPARHRCRERGALGGRAPMTLVVAHRGSSGVLAEHTVRAYERAIDDGADALECDVRLTRDGVLVCVHDRRVDRTSSGRGVVSTLELADLAELDFGSWHRSGQEAPDMDRRQVLTLEKLLETVADCG